MCTVTNNAIKNYIKRDAPGYAVLVSGAWGVGKTYQVRESLSTKKYYYVSLFGASTKYDVYDAIISELARWSAGAIRTKVNKRLSCFAKCAAIAKNWIWRNTSFFRRLKIRPQFISVAIRAIPGVVRLGVLDQIESGSIIVFDDVERSKLKPRELFGIFDYFLTTHQCKVILLCDESALKKRAGYKNYLMTKEKTIGHTIVAEPQIDQAYDSFVSGLGKYGASFLKKQKPTILDVFRQSGCKSLRILKQVVTGLRDLYMVLSNDHLNNSEGVNCIVSTFCAFEIGIQSGRLQPNDLKFRFKQHPIDEMTISNEDKELPMNQSIIDESRRYASMDLASDIFSDEALHEMFVSRRYDKSIITDSINESEHYNDIANTRPWRILINFENHDDETLRRAHKDMQDDFKSRSVGSIGEMLHMFSLHMYFSEGNEDGISVENIENECERYIQDVLEEGGIVVDEPNSIFHMISFGYKNFGYFTRPSYLENFERLRVRLREAVEEAVKMQSVQRGETLLQDIASAPRECCQNVSRKLYSKEGQFQALVFPFIDPAQFVDVWLSIPEKHWGDVSMMLSTLFSHKRDYSFSSKHLGWLKSVADILREKQQSVSGLRRIRVRHMIDYIKHTAEGIAK